MKRYCKILEKADKHTAERLSERYPVLSRKEKSELYYEINKRRNTISEFVGEEQVHGVERYHRSRLHKFSNIAAVTLSLTIIVGGIAYALNSTTHPRKDVKVASESTSSTETVNEEVTEHLPRKLKEYDMSTQEGVFYKTLNCIDYYDKASGEFISSTLGLSMCDIVEFETDIVESRSYTHYRVCNLYNPLEVVDGMPENAEIMDDQDIIQFCDGKNGYTYNQTSKKFISILNGACTRAENYDIPDSGRNYVSEGINHSNYREQATNAPYARKCLEPWEMTFGYLNDFNSWDIQDTEKYLGRECVSIKGTLSGAYGEKQNVSEFTFLIDKETGVLLKYIGKDANDDLSEFLIVRDIAFDDNARNVRTIDFADLEDNEINDICKDLSDRYVQLQKYIYERSATNDNYVTFTLKLSNSNIERNYYKIEDDYSNDDNLFWNAHSIEEIKRLSEMDDSLFEKIYTNRTFAKIDDNIKNGDVVSFGGKDPILIEYNDAMYTQNLYDDYGNNLLVPFNDKPGIVNLTNNMIIFTRRTGFTSKYAEINSIPWTFEFTIYKSIDNNNEWKLLSVGNLTEESDIADRNENEANNSYIENKTDEEIGDLVEEFARLTCALSSNNYISSDETITYNLYDGSFIRFAPYSNPFYNSPEIIESAVKNMFTDNFIKEYLDTIRPDDEIYTAWKVKDFSEYSDGYVFTEADFSSDNYGKNTPFPYVFILHNGRFYRSRDCDFSIPHFPYEVHSISCEPIINGNTATVNVEYSYTTDIRQEKTVYVTFSCVKDNNGWKIDDII